MRRSIPLSFFVVALLANLSAQAPAATPPGAAVKPTATAATPLRSRNLPEFEVDKAWPKVPPQWKLGDPSSFAIDGKDNVWLLHRPRTVKAGETAAPPVVVFDTAGAFVKAWGGEDAGAQWPEREHGIHVDAKGFVWITGNNCPTNGIAGLKPVNDDQILKLTTDGKVALRIGESNGSKGNADTRNVHRAADVWVHPPSNELYVADGYGNHRVIVFDAQTGAFKRMWGAFGNKPVDDDHCEVVTPKTFPPGQGPPNFSIVHALRVANDGIIYVADRENRRVHPPSNELYVADGYGNHRVIVFDAQTGAFKRMWGAFGNKPVDDDHCEVVTPKTFPPGQGPPNFSIVHALRVANDGIIYVADRENRRVQSFTPNGTFLKQLVKTDTQFARNLALSHDPVQQFLYVGNGMDIAIVDRRSMEVVGTIKVPGMIGGGHQIAVDSKGNLYIAGTAAGLQKLTFKGMAVPKS